MSKLKMIRKKIKVEVTIEVSYEKIDAEKDAISSGLNLIREGANGIGCGENGVYEYRILSKKNVK